MISKREDLLELLKRPLKEIISIANELRKDYCGKEFHLCSIMNARSGLCSGDCAYCAQSSVSKADIAVYPMKSVDEILSCAEERKKIGAQRFSIVTSGETISDRELEIVLAALPKIKSLGMRACASLGMLGEDKLLVLKQAGLDRYHHNIESSERFYSKIVSSHKFEERINTVISAKRAGLEVCSGGIIGMGESWEDRIDMIMTIKELDAESVPINLFIPIKGTPLQGVPFIDKEDALRTIALFRIAMPDKEIRLIAGREIIFKDNPIEPFMAGANGMMVGGYLTKKGNLPQEDKELVEQVSQLL